MVTKYRKLVINTIPSIRIIPKQIPKMETKLLCADFLEAVIRFYKEPKNEIAFKKWLAEKGENGNDTKGN